jgi:hypothetical protein
MEGDGGHGARVDAWLEHAAQGPTVESLAEAFETAFTALWRRAHRTLGEVTLSAITDRVLYVAAEQYPIFAAITLDTAGVRWDGFRQRAGTRPLPEIAAGVRFVLMEFLSVLGKLTGEVLTPPLHAELEALTSSSTLAVDSSEPGQASSSPVNGEDMKP